ncbi:ATP-binding cassette domain-containing protein [Pseudoxanthomonas suwonensis]|uniref:ABC transporter ATP-binding protein n=1 Tax=Pseudoxanthomonas suwonensis TaxID=314722 RepID=A0A0E3YZ60_9GAMM|nr:ATP-binding cassette domain-containing protein [Pseudoxanthomonas suwonensis]AKC85823.1 ABC transporter ATP-binding protein [Pseudoxanthomonas suwonensis]
MPHPSLALEGVTQVLADGRTLFSDLHERFDARPTALVGRNGVGKSVLARILAGRLVPTAGRCVRSGRVHFLPQQVVPAAGDSVADLAGLGEVLAALARIEAGGCDPADFERVGERWTLRGELQEALHAQGLRGIDPDTPATRLSGGEAMRVALAGAWLSQADFLILDEPGNHLDRGARQRLLAQLRQWRRGLLVVSHERPLLQAMARIVELTPAGLRSHGGGYGEFLEQREREGAAAQRDLAHARAERARLRRELALQHEREQRRQSRDRRQRRDANQAAILLDRQQQRSEQSAGRRTLLRQQAGDQAERQVREAAARVVDEAPVAMFAPLPATATQRRVAELEDVELPFAPRAAGRLSLAVSGTQRIGVVGDNGSGKSTLLRVLAGQMPPVRGQRRVRVPVALLDQTLSILPAQATVLASLRLAAPGIDEATLRMWLAQLGLDASRIAVPAAALSGGERLKAALACVLHAAEPPQLLLLDEPDNHLDLASKEALERMLCAYPGALAVVSHDDGFLDRLRLDTRLQAGGEGWSLAPW